LDNKYNIFGLFSVQNIITATLYNLALHSLHLQAIRFIPFLLCIAWLSKF